MINACGATEGLNEFVVFTTTAAGAVSTYEVNYGSANPPTTNKMSGLNAVPKTGAGVITATGGCTITVVTSPATVLPSGARVVFIPAATDNNYDFTSLCNGAGLYVVYIANATAPSNWTATGTAANNPAAPGRYFQVTNSASGGCNATTAPVVNYIGNNWTSNQDGNFVGWNASGTPTYSNNGCSNVVLAQKNITLTAEYKQNNTLIKWTVLNPPVIRSCEIEKSEDGRSFITIATQQANALGSYIYIDEIEKEGMCFYRIKATTTIGEILYSDIKIVKVTSNNLALLAIYPAIPTSEITFTLNSKLSGRANIQIVTTNGKVQLSKNIIVMQGTNNHILQLNNLARGLYYIKIVGCKQIINGKFIKY